MVAFSAHRAASRRLAVSDNCHEKGLPGRYVFFVAYAGKSYMVYLPAYPQGGRVFRRNLLYFPVSASPQGETLAVNESRDNASGFNHAAGRRRRWTGIEGKFSGYGVPGKLSVSPCRGSGYASLDVRS